MNDLNGAVIDKSGNYRYRLWRTINVNHGPTCAFVMLNPSTADGTADDPTVRRCIDFAHRWGFARLEIVNLYSWRASNPSELLRPGLILQGPEHWAHFHRVMCDTSLVVCAWGAHKMAEQAAPIVLDSIQSYAHTPRCLGKTISGGPRHPLYLKKDALLVLYPGEPA